MRPQRRIPAWVRVGAGVVAFLCVMTLLSFIPRGGSATPREGAASGGLYPIRAHTLSARAQAGGGGGVAAHPAHIPASRQPEAAPPRTPHERPACDAWECTRPLQGGGVGEPGTDKPLAVAQTNTQAGEGDAIERGQSSRSGDCTASDANLFVCGRAARDAQNSLDTSSMTTWIQGGGRLPILLIAGKRADMVKKTLDALLKVRGVQARDVAVLQDGTDAGVESVVKAAGVFLHQHRDNTAAPGDHSVAIAMHFKYSIQYAFSSFAPAAPGLIIVEDDFLFSDDFYEYFHAVAPVLEADKTLWLASAWNDNGFDYLVADPYALRRTRFFPGLGWLLPRAIWTQELQATWPTQHWDHWLRNPQRHRNRDVLVPEIPRDYHAGVKGSFMDRGTHNKYFGSIAMHADADFSWDTPLAAASLRRSVQPYYGARLEHVLTSRETVHLTSVNDVSTFSSGVGVVWYDCPPGSPTHEHFRGIASYFGLWHEGARGSWEGVHELWWMGTAKLYLVNTCRGAGSITARPADGGVVCSPFARLQPRHVKPLSWTAFRAAERPLIPKHHALFDAKFVSPLSHLEGGEDANGPQDNAKNEARAAGGPLRARTRVKQPAADAKHTRFGDYLRLPALPAVKDVSTLPEGTQVVASDVAGDDCNKVCAAQRSAQLCYAPLLSVINRCDTLRAAFKCSVCQENYGADQPAFVLPLAGGEGECLVNQDATLFSCDGTFPRSRRLCPCITRAQHAALTADATRYEEEVAREIEGAGV